MRRLHANNGGMFGTVFLACLFAFLSLQPVFPVPPLSDMPARDVLESRGEIYFSFDHPGDELLLSLVDVVSIDFVSDGRVYAYANHTGFGAFERASIAYAVHIPPGLQYADKQMNMLSEVNISAVESWNFYPTYEAYESMMKQYAESFPGLFDLVEIKTLASGRRLMFGVIGRSGEPDGKPRFMYTSTMHGDETIGFNLMLRLIHYLLHQYGHDPEITRLVDDVEIWICPNENPDGTYTNDNATVVGATRGNGNLVDLNRNYPHVVSGNQTGTPQEETLAMMGLVDSLGFVMSANIHSGFECVNYPWDHWPSSVRKHADHEWWRFVSAEYADTARYYSHNNYMDPGGPSFFRGVTHGGDWYTVSGGRQDYMNYYASQRELTLELSTIKLLPADSLDNHWHYNHRSLINYMRQATYGIHGVVADRLAEQPLAAMVSVPGYDADRSEVFSSARSGYFFRPLPEGTYDLRITMNDYPIYQYRDLKINNYETLHLATDPGMVVFDPIPLAFLPVIAPGQSAALLGMHNPGSQYISLVVDSFTGDPVFDLAMPGKQSIVLPPGGRDILSLRFAADEPGQYYGGIVFSHEMPHQPFLEIPLQGNAPEEAAIIYSQTDELNFGMVNLRTKSALNARVENKGNLPLTIQGAAFSDPVFSLETEMPLSVAPAAHADIQVVFSPDSVKTYHASMHILSNAIVPAPAIFLTGEGADNTFVKLSEQNEALAAVSPNPVNSSSVLYFRSNTPGNVLLGITDSRGFETRRFMHRVVAAGHQQLHVGQYFTALAPGIYFLYVLTDETIMLAKVIKL